MDLELTNRVVLVTGGSRGIGLACAEAFAREGAKVAIAARDEAALQFAAAALAVHGSHVAAFPADLGDPAAASALVAAVEARLGPIDVLVTCAGAAQRHPPESLTPGDWRAGMEAKYFPTIHAVQAVLPGMAARGRGAIVNVVGQGGKVASVAHLAGGAANAGLMLASAGLASAYAAKGVRVNVINPGTTLTGRAERAAAVEAARLGVTPEEARRRMEARVPMGRFARPEEIAAVAVFLASDRASYVTGAVIAMDGGATPTVV